MPDFKVMGTLPDKASQQLTDMIVNKNLDNNDAIVSSIVTILGSQIKNVKADNLQAPVETKYQISTNYDTENPVGVFYLISKGSLILEVAMIGIPPPGLGLFSGNAPFGFQSTVTPNPTPLQTAL